jgi:UDP-3-O-acyl N-acetylglucosamine deacetylase
MLLTQTYPKKRVEVNLRPSQPCVRHQRTLAHEAKISGRGIITGQLVHLRFVPQPANCGLVFQRVDIPEAPPIPARASSVSGTARRTTLGTGSNQVTLVEHVLSALAGLRINNCIIELDGPEPPGLDGSSEGFVEIIEATGSTSLDAPVKKFSPIEPITISSNGSVLSFHPRQGDELWISYILDYGPFSPIHPQSHSIAITPDAYRQELARCRTFVLESEAQELQKQGIGRHLTPSELLVFGPKGLIDNRLRFPDEPARHKILDLVGDLALCGFDLAGHVVAYRSGHPLNVELARALSAIA